MLDAVLVWVVHPLIPWASCCIAFWDKKHALLWFNRIEPNCTDSLKQMAQVCDITKLELISCTFNGLEWFKEVPWNYDLGSCCCFFGFCQSKCLGKTITGKVSKIGIQWFLQVHLAQSRWKEVGPSDRWSTVLSSHVSAVFHASLFSQPQRRWIWKNSLLSKLPPLGTHRYHW